MYPDHSVTESLEESAAAYTKATAKKCILEKVEVRTGEEAESNVLQVNGHFRFDAYTCPGYEEVYLICSA